MKQKEFVVDEQEFKVLMEKLEKKGYLWAVGQKPTQYAPYYLTKQPKITVICDEELKVLTYSSSTKVFKKFKKGSFESFMAWAQYTEFNLGIPFRDFYYSDDNARDMYEQFLKACNEGKIDEESTNIYWEEEE